MRCNCDLDTWEPERSSGHSWVCRIHKAACKIKDDPEYVPHSFGPRRAEIEKGGVIVAKVEEQQNG